jgi:hypothetical protein
MSTHAAIAIKYDGKLIETYNHSDGYPSWLGVELVETCRHINALGGWGMFKKNVAKLHLVKCDETPSRYWRSAYSHSRQDVSTGKDWYTYLRDYQGANGIESILTGELKHWMDESGYLFEAHYGYVINLDDFTFEFWYDGALKFSTRLDVLNIKWKKG